MAILYADNGATIALCDKHARTMPHGPAIRQWDYRCDACAQARQVTTNAVAAVAEAAVMIHTAQRSAPDAAGSEVVRRRSKN